LRPGIYNLVQPDTATELGDQKVEHCLSTRPDVLVSANPGCLVQLAAGLKRAGKQVPVLHMIEVIDASIQGRPASALKAPKE
jgi:glycolate oxidase iron-sulfur subunit